FSLQTWVAVLSVFYGLEAEVALAPQAPLDPAAALGDAGNVLAELVFDLAGPGHELEAERSVDAACFDHREAARRERELAAIDARHMFARLRLDMGQPSR